MKRIAIVALYASAVFLLGFCGVEGTSLLISDDQEAELGAQVNNEVVAEYPPINDSEVQAWVNELGSRLASASTAERTGVSYRFQVLDADIVNAFAAPGGYIYLTDDLILAADTEAEVAGVLGHEVGHVAHRHGVAKLERQVAVGAITDLFFGDSFGADAINFVTSFVLGTEYSQDQESDADLMGVDFTYAAGISPFGLVDFFYKLEDLSGGSLTPDWLSSHPQPLDRAAATEARIQQLHPGMDRNTPGFATDITGDFASIQARLAQ